MSLAFRIILALFATLFGVVMCLWAQQSDKALGGYLFAGFCFAIAAICFTKGRWVHFFGGLVASGVLLATLAYLLVMVIDGGPVDTGRRSDSSLVNSVKAFLVFGLPAAAYLWKTRFGSGKLTEPPRDTAEGEHTGD